MATGPVISVDIGVSTPVGHSLTWAKCRKEEVTGVRIAIDIDHTITASPVFFEAFIENQLRAGNEVHVLTGRTTGPEGDYDSPPERVAQLSRLGITRYTRLVQITRLIQHPDIGIGKGEYCKKNRIDLIIEDDMLYIKEIARISPTTQTFLIV